ncbi:hypothetical protein JTB14_035826 [Gonioctena quinquepunctata]|nr:hypothetical protein JTB14_035826 [Gonioctena quinquepunctata]
MEYMDWSLMGPAMLFLNQYFNTFVKEYYILWLCLVWVSLDFIRYCYQICEEICDYLHVGLLNTISGRPPKKDNVWFIIIIYRNKWNQ